MRTKPRWMGYVWQFCFWWIVGALFATVYRLIFSGAWSDPKEIISCGAYGLLIGFGVWAWRQSIKMEAEHKAWKARMDAEIEQDRAANRAAIEEFRRRHREGDEWKDN